MKTQFHSVPRKGFTLVEIIVVISIIVVLASITYGPIQGMLTKAQLQESAKECSDLQGAIENFYQDNSCFPIKDFPEDDAEKRNDGVPGILITTAVDDPSELVTILLNAEGPDSDPINAKGKRYLSGTVQERPMGGIYQDGKRFGYYDRWGSPYYILLNDGVNDLADPFTGKTIFNKKVIVYGLGADKEGGQLDAGWQDPEKTEDNVYSWKTKKK